MSEALLNAGRQTLMLELQEASRLPERLGDDFVRAANIILHCEGKVVVSGIGKSGHIGKKIAATLLVATLALGTMVGCGSKGNDNTADSADQTGASGDITILSRESRRGAAWRSGDD